MKSRARYSFSFLFLMFCMFAGRNSGFAGVENITPGLTQTISSGELNESEGVLQSTLVLSSGANFQYINKFKTGFHSPAASIPSLILVFAITQGSGSFLCLGVKPPLFLLNRTLLI